LNVKLLVFDSHPVQYRAPVWQAIEKIQPGILHVIYASDCSVRGHADQGFGQPIAWDEPLLTGYANTVLNSEKGDPLSGWGSLTGRGVKKVINEMKPDAILLTGFNYKYDLVVYLLARLKRIPLWLRCETQDEALRRSKLKSFIRALTYKVAYPGLSKAFFIGELNKLHYLAHGIMPSKLKPAHYATVDRFAGLSKIEKTQLRENARFGAGIHHSAFVVGFSGKFISKKNPDILFRMLQHLPQALLKRVHLYFMGSGEMEEGLKDLAADALKQYHVKSFFSGFINQSQLAAHYLAMDVMVLPSRRMGETWGLVANEAMQAGCAVVVSDAAGCAADFKSWKRFRVFKEADEMALAACVNDLNQFSRDFEWAKESLQVYSIQAVASAIVNELPKI
jgi:glycosyltransferase involved in cell wall biosynthesis